jgi:ferredoxin
MVEAKKAASDTQLSLTVNGQARGIAVEPGTTLLEALRDGLGLPGTKKGCDRGECGACTVHTDDRRTLSCMALAAVQEGKRITTIEGLEQEGNLHPLQAAFIEHDGLQRLLHVRTDHVGCRRDRGGESGVAERRHDGPYRAVHDCGSVAGGNP